MTSIITGCTLHFAIHKALGQRVEIAHRDGGGNAGVVWQRRLAGVRAVVEVNSTRSITSTTETPTPSVQASQQYKVIDAGLQSSTAVPHRRRDMGSQPGA
jgi:hypothetical protein